MKMIMRFAIAMCLIAMAATTIYTVFGKFFEPKPIRQVHGNNSFEQIPIEDEKLDLFPFRNTFAWKIKPVATKKYVRFVLRTVEQDDPKDSLSSFFPTEITLPTKGKDRTQGSHGIETGLFEGQLTCQLIDLKEIGLTSPTEKSLRVLIRLRSRDSSVMTLQDTTLPGKFFDGNQTTSAEWNDDKLHLLTFRTKEPGKVYTHYLFLMHSDNLEN